MPHSSLADLAVAVGVLFVALAAWRGWRQGAPAVVRVVCTAAGLLAGLAAAGSLSTSLSPVTQVLLGVACVIGGLLLGVAVGRMLSVRAIGRPGVPGRVVGALARGSATALVCWLLAGAVPGLGHDGLLQHLRDAAPADLAALVPAQGTPPSTAEVAAMKERVARSILLVHADGCRGVVGTGFVAASHTVVTNAHVVRGAREVSVTASDGREYTATPVLVDDRADLAVLRVSGLDAAPLTLATGDAGNGTPAVLVGHPGGGPLVAGPAVVLQRLPLPDPGWRSGLAGLHEGYRLQAVVRHGNSGSPLLDRLGAVIGVVNASSTIDRSHGFAITVDELRADLARAADSRGASTGACTT